MIISRFKHFMLCTNGKGIFYFGTERECRGLDWGVPVNQYGSKEEIIQRLKNFIEIDSRHPEISQLFFPTIKMYNQFLKRLQNYK